ncbi:MAG: ParB/RepB/Spo0J family partition protein [Chloroflexi bacterium]|nr:ParB/RepB/Spo0J family partition protein [Chloroflexota bacterium]
MARKGGLGKGLEALIPGDFSNSQNHENFLAPISMIMPNPRQPRDHMDEENLQDLANSIREHGILQPLIVTEEPATGMYTLIAGERRLRAATIAGLNKVPVIVRTATDQERLELALIENVQRADLSPLETAEAYHQLAEEFSLSHEEISERVGKGRVSVTNTLRLLKLPDPAKKALREGLITEGHARALLGLSTTQSQLGALQTILNHGMNVRQVEDLIRKLNGQKNALPEKQPVNPDIREIEDRLSESLGTRVSLRHGNKGGTLTIHYYSDEELNGLLSRFMPERK